MTVKELAEKLTEFKPSLPLYAWNSNIGQIGTMGVHPGVLSIYSTEEDRTPLVGRVMEHLRLFPDTLAVEVNGEPLTQVYQEADVHGSYVNLR